jgi:hypothetical protein
VNVDRPSWFPPTLRSAPAASNSWVTESLIMYSSDTSPAKAGLPVAKVQSRSANVAYGAITFATFSVALACAPLTIAT